MAPPASSPTLALDMRDHWEDGAGLSPNNDDRRKTNANERPFAAAPRSQTLSPRACAVEGCPASLSAIPPVSPACGRMGGARPVTPFGVSSGNDDRCKIGPATNFDSTTRVVAPQWDVMWLNSADAAALGQRSRQGGLLHARRKIRFKVCVDDGDDMAADIPDRQGHKNPTGLVFDLHRRRDGGDADGAAPMACSPEDHPKITPSRTPPPRCLRPRLGLATFGSGVLLRRAERMLHRGDVGPDFDPRDTIVLQVAPFSWKDV